MQRYESYKPSGTRWLGDVPAHWNMQPLIAIATKKSISNCPEKELLSVYLDRGVIKFSDVDEKRTNATSEDLSKYQEVLPGDFVLNNQQAWRGSVGVSEHEGIVSPAYIVLRLTKDLNPKFANYLFRDRSMVSQYLVCSKGVGTIQRNLYWPQLKRSRVAIPPLEEQHRIVTFLDQKTAEIDAAVAKKEELIDLLREQRTIEINQAVTLGVNRNTSFRQSNVDWIDVLPSHWEVVPLKHVSEVQSGLTLGKNYAHSRRTKSYPYLRVANVQDGYIDLSAVTEITLPIREARSYFLRSGDILVTEGGDIDKLGRGNCWHGQIDECLHQNHVFAVRILKKVRPEYVALITGVSYARRYFTTTANKTTNLASTNKTKLGNLPLLVPPIEEQDAILKHSNRVKAQFEALINPVKKEIAALKEMRDVLIAESVTGKIKI